MMARLTSQDQHQRPTRGEALDAFEDMVGRTTTTAEQELGRLVSEAAQRKAFKHLRRMSRSKGNERCPERPPFEDVERCRSPVESTASVMQRRGGARPRHREAVTAGMELSTDAHDEFVAEGRLGLLEAHREFDRKHRSGAKFMTFAFPRVQRRVQEAFEVLGGVPARRVSRGEEECREWRGSKLTARGQVHTKEYVAHRVGEGADELHLDPFTAIGERLEKNAVRAAIERLPDAQQRQVLRLMYVDGLSQSDVGRSASNQG